MMEFQKWGAITRAHLQQNIILLQLLREIVELPSAVSIHKVATDKSQRVMSLQREKELAESLAYLASWSDDPAHVVAVCIEENSSRDGMIINLAVNSGSLEKVIRGFEKMANILEKTARKGLQFIFSLNSDTLLTLLGQEAFEDIDKFLHEVVSLNRARILCRLRSRHATYRCNYSSLRKSEPIRLPLISEALKISAASLGTLPSDSEMIVAIAENLSQLSTDLESLMIDEINSEPGLKLLVKIVVTCKQLQSLKGFHLALARRSDSIKPSPKVITGLVLRLSRYHAASTFLVHAAERYPVFSCIKILPIIIKAPKAVQTNLNPFAVTVVDDLLNRSKRQRSTFSNKIWTRPALEIKEKISVAATAKAYPVHAEIQLLLYHEAHNSIYPPRIICSYKKSCYLCNLFFRLHGKFIVPSSHGRVYEKWGMPERFDTFQLDLNDDIHETLKRLFFAVKETVQDVIICTRRPLLQAPNESVIFLSPTWSTVTLAQRVTSGQKLIQKESAVDNGSPEKNEYSGNEIAGMQSSMKSVQWSACSKVSVATQAEAERELCQVVVPLNAPRFHTDICTGSGVGFCGEYKTEYFGGDKPIDLTSISESTILPGFTYGSTKCDGPPLETSSEKNSAVEFTSAFLALQRGKPVSYELSSSGRSFKVGTPKIHLTLSCDQVTNTIASLNSYFPNCHDEDSRNQIKDAALPPNHKYRVNVKWLQPDETIFIKSKLLAIDLIKFPSGAQKTLCLQDEGGTKIIWLSKGRDIVSVEYIPL